MSKENTAVTDVTFENLDDIFGTGEASVMTPVEGEEKKPGVLSNPTADSKEFIDNARKSTEEPPAEETAAEETSTAEETATEETTAEETPAATTEEVEALLDPNAEIEEAPDDDRNKGGRPTNLEAVAKELLEKGLIKPFDGEEDFSKYTQKDYIELFEMNVEENRKELQTTVEQQFFQSLSPRLQQAYHYIAQGGQDEVALFQALAATEEMRQMDISTEEGQEYAVAQYYQAINFGTPEEIHKEINSLKDRGELEEKAQRFKPKLDQMQESVVQQKLQQQELQNQQKHAQMQIYMDSVFDVLKTEEINGIKLDSNVQNMLYEGLVNPKYPSISGKSTNMLGALLEKYQWVEPNHELVAEALYLLADPEGYRKAVRNLSDKETVEKTVRMLKTEESASKNKTSATAEEKDDTTHQRKQTIQRRKNNFFARDSK